MLCIVYNSEVQYTVQYFLQYCNIIECIVRKSLRNRRARGQPPGPALVCPPPALQPQEQTELLQGWQCRRRGPLERVTVYEVVHVLLGRHCQRSSLHHTESQRPRAAAVEQHMGHEFLFAKKRSQPSDPRIKTKTQNMEPII
jgi:hypothetical protein